MIQFYAKTKVGFTTHSSLEAFVFPGGEPHIRDTAPETADGTILAQIAYVTHPTMEDLFTLAMWADVVFSRQEQAWVGMPYLPFARADRGHPDGTEVLADFLSFTMIDKIAVLDPHSPPSTDALVNDVVFLPFEDIVKRSVGNNTYSGVIAPDAGAHDRAARIGKALGVPVFQAEKKRVFATGKLTGFGCEPLVGMGRFLLVDDICDGGGTFVGLADHLNAEQQIGMARLDLWVSHGIFSKGFEELGRRFNNIFTTDSWFTPDYTTPAYIHVTPLLADTFGALSA